MEEQLQEDYQKETTTRRRTGPQRPHGGGALHRQEEGGGGGRVGVGVGVGGAVAAAVLCRPRTKSRLSEIVRSFVRWRAAGRGAPLALSNKEVNIGCLGMDRRSWGQKTENI